MQWVVRGQQPFAGLDEQGAQGAPAVLAQGAIAFILAALDHTGIEPEIADQVLALGKALDLADDGDERIGRHQVQASQFVEAQEVGMFLDLQGHQAAQASAAFARGDQATVHFL